MNESKLGVGVVGCGGIAMLSHLPAISEGEHSELVAVADTKREQREMAIKQFGGDAHADYRELVARSDVDVVLVSTPVFLHHDIVMEALSAGKHVLCEKPLARTPGEARAMVDAASAAELRLGVMHQQRYAPAARLIRETLAHGTIGDPVGASMRSGHGGPEVRVPGSDMVSWVYDAAKSGGGVTYDTGVHALDLLCWLLGRVKSVSAEMATPVRDIPVEEESRLILTFESGLLAVAEFSWLQLGGRNGLEVYGSDGLVQFDRTENVVRIGKRIGKGEELEWREERSEARPWHYWHRFLIADYCRAVLGDEQASHPLGSEALHTQRILDAAFQSAAKGGRVEVERD